MSVDAEGYTRMGGDFPPILNLTNKEGKAGASFEGEFVSYRHTTKKEGRKEKENHIFTFVVGETNIDGITKGEKYSVFASGQLKYLLGSVITDPDKYKGKLFKIKYLGKDKMKAGPWKNKLAHKFDVRVKE